MFVTSNDQKPYSQLSLKIHNVEFKDFSFARYYKASFIIFDVL